MSRYGTFKYSTQKYGVSVNPNLLWALEVDWDDDGVFDGSNDAVRVTGLRSERGDQYFISGDGRGLNLTASATPSLRWTTMTGGMIHTTIQARYMGNYSPAYWCAYGSGMASAERITRSSLASFRTSNPTGAWEPSTWCLRMDGVGCLTAM